MQFYEVDGAGIVHFSWFFRYMEEAEHALWRSAGLTIDLAADVSFPRVAAAFDFKRPLRFGDEFDARIQITSIRTKTIAYSCELRFDGEIAAVGTMTIVCVSKKSQPMRAVPFPVDILDRLEAVNEADPRP